ncbi:uncharacterized protein LOC112514911 [Cynara cardunculus var. scolymus]|uniref:uncharacterized protein LOC112514911 n=1 Tax=Cynara cardunculus var. scolymus TaxID=59895 RepID=UPI000D626745|nr:uncharacterized protein LOC112514911 [Cynara cardunculus var. scolymus]
MMKGFGLLVLVTALICLCFLSFPPPPDQGGAGRKLKGTVNDVYKVDDASDVNLLDYHQDDPVPSSKASINHGPVQHGTPLIPYIPNLPPPGPDHPNHVDAVFP